MARSTARVALSSTLRSEARVSLVGFSEMEVTRVPWGTVTATVRYWPSGSPVLPSTTASGSGWNGPAKRPTRTRLPMSGTCWTGMSLVRMGAGSGCSIGPEGRERMTLPERFSSWTYTSAETRRDRSAWLTGRPRSAA